MTGFTRSCFHQQATEVSINKRAEGKSWWRKRLPKAKIMWMNDEKAEEMSGKKMKGRKREKQIGCAIVGPIPFHVCVCVCESPRFRCRTLVTRGEWRPPLSITLNWPAIQCHPESHEMGAVAQYSELATMVFSFLKGKCLYLHIFTHKPWLICVNTDSSAK